MIRRAGALVALIGLVALGLPLLGDQKSSEALPLAIGRVHARFQPSKGKIFVLVIGSDARTGNPDRSRADAVHLAGLNTKTMKGGILNFPRDSWVSIPGSGSGRINEALYRGGPELLARTVESITGIRIDYWIMVGFEGFQKIIRGLNPVPLKIKHGMYDPGGSGARIPAGQKRLGAANSLAFVRTRKSLPGGDITRSTNQGRFLLALLRKFRNEVALNPGAVMKWMAVTRHHARFDLSLDEMFRLGILASEVRAKDVGNVTVPVSIGAVGAASVVFIQGGAHSIYARFKRTASL